VALPTSGEKKQNELCGKKGAVSEGEEGKKLFLSSKEKGKG